MNKKEKLNIKSIVKRNNQMLFSEMDGELVMLSIENSEYYGMDKIGSRIWEIIEQPKSVEELITSLIEEYDVSHEQCEADVLDFLSEMQKKEVILLEESE